MLSFISKAPPLDASLRRVYIFKTVNGFHMPSCRYSYQTNVIMSQKEGDKLLLPFVKSMLLNPTKSHCTRNLISMHLLIIIYRLQLGRAKRKCVFEHAQNAEIQSYRTHEQSLKRIFVLHGYILWCSNVLLADSEGPD